MPLLSWDTRLAERPTTPRLFLLLITLLMPLVPVQCSQGRPSWRYVSSEVVIPRKEIHHDKGFQVSGRLSYSLRFTGQRHVIHLQRKTLLWPRHLLLTTQDDQGALQMDYPFFPSDCYYLGHLEGVPLSTVTVDTCYGGLKGIMKLNDLAFEIRPLKNSHRFEHLVSQIVSDVNATGTTYGLGHIEHTGLHFSTESSGVVPRMSSKDYASHAGAIKGHIQAANSVYTISRNITTCTLYLVEIFNLVDSFWQNLQIKFFIFMITIYSQSEPFQLSYSVPGAIQTYYVNNFFNRVRPDLCIFIHKDRPRDFDFDPVPRSICQPTGIIFFGIQGRNTFMAAIIISRAIGRSAGLDFDDPRYCICHRRATCIMFRYPILTDSFSNCSIAKLQQILGVPDDLACVFHQKLESRNRTSVQFRCGNNIVEGTEECDCGSFKFCYSNECCESDCRLTAKSVCDKGMCCANCTYSPPGTLCRTIENICDLPEYCDGGKVTCPKDIYLQDGTPCTEEGYCYHGNCTDRTMHCKEIFGISAHNADDLCYNINKEQYRFGHCLRAEISLRYTACTESNKMCGRLQCTNVTNLPRLQEHVSFHQSIINGAPCFGLDEHRATESTDAGRVRDGALCAKGKFCDRGSCNGTLVNLNYDCTPEKCNFRGTCNSNRNCHCHIGWDPPKCIGEGPGGSIDSGPLPRKMRSIHQSKQAVVYLRVIFARIYVFIASLLLGFATKIKNFRIIKIEELNLPPGHPLAAAAAQRRK